eukprot:Unigene8249_Nuclearia_a/m.25324 Unigene8249_Nuclearia_a/g.25324  ORF Unigene8249_Nuclearia_a/g.25324 Unigene8249_Nuclearia_a/m.25324 type:complete len:519 (+) Unigene8249_Nuclearia_a:728-2284(+)
MSLSSSASVQRASRQRAAVEPISGSWEHSSTSRAISSIVDDRLWSWIDAPCAVVSACVRTKSLRARKISASRLSKKRTVVSSSRSMICLASDSVTWHEISQNDGMSSPAGAHCTIIVGACRPSSALAALARRFASCRHSVRPKMSPRLSSRWLLASVLKSASVGSTMKSERMLSWMSSSIFASSSLASFFFDPRMDGNVLPLVLVSTDRLLLRKSRNSLRSGDARLVYVALMVGFHGRRFSSDAICRQLLTSTSLKIVGASSCMQIGKSDQMTLRELSRNDAVRQSIMICWSTTPSWFTNGCCGSNRRSLSSFSISGTRWRSADILSFLATYVAALQMSTYDTAATSARFLVLSDFLRLTRNVDLDEVTAALLPSLRTVMLSRMSGQSVSSMDCTGQKTIFFLWLSARPSKMSKRMSGPPARRRCDWQSDTNSIGCELIQFQMAFLRITAKLTSTVRLNERHDDDSSCSTSLSRRELRLMCSSRYRSNMSAFSSGATESAWMRALIRAKKIGKLDAET